ncbi:DBH-like monooxygenase protein 2 homolog [Scyliorhinus canicula]|uniref:DBH-like monooxygenase protein 2 homolog n=1 Tax=Scyliorhinus canicula TaxID=7830 RepID=UPI0018F27A7F|nr:DBH-like monooxygenase protein 2 homolog [Scyliorhinus canicula]
MGTGVVDNCGFKLHLTTNLRKFDVGIFWTGVQVAEFLVIPPKASSFKTYAYCDTSPVDKEEGKKYTDMQIFGSILHTHLTGSKVRILQFRGGEQIRTIAQDKYYDFNLQESRMLREPVTVRRGDVLITECTYNTENRSNITWGGLATTEEMCLAFMFYYPKNELLTCLSYVTARTASSVLNITGDTTEEIITSMWSWDWNQTLIDEVETKLRDADQDQVIGTNTAYKHFKGKKIPVIPKEKVARCSRMGENGGSVRLEGIAFALGASLLAVAWLLVGP